MNQREAEMRYRIGAYLLGVSVNGAVREPVVKAKLHYLRVKKANGKDWSLAASASVANLQEDENA